MGCCFDKYRCFLMLQSVHITCYTLRTLKEYITVHPICFSVTVWKVRKNAGIEVSTIPKWDIMKAWNSLRMYSTHFQSKSQALLNTMNSCCTVCDWTHTFHPVPDRYRISDQWLKLNLFITLYKSLKFSFILIFHTLTSRTTSFLEFILLIVHLSQKISKCAVICCCLKFLCNFPLLM